MKFNRQEFFKSYRRTFGALEQSQVDGLEYLLARMEADERITSIRQWAYVLATVKHETNSTFQPVEEIGMRRTAEGRWYNVVNGRRVYRNYGFYYGRGYVQITWEGNYRKFGRLLDIDLVSHPERTLEPATAYEILVMGMTRGMFTGKNLFDFINAQQTDYVSARRIVNGTDKAAHIARLAAGFEMILRTSLEAA